MGYHDNDTVSGIDPNVDSIHDVAERKPLLDATIKVEVSVIDKEAGLGQQYSAKSIFSADYAIPAGQTEQTLAQIGSTIGFGASETIRSTLKKAEGTTLLDRTLKLAEEGKAHVHSIPLDDKPAEEQADAKDEADEPVAIH